MQELAALGDPSTAVFLATVQAHAPVHITAEELRLVNCRVPKMMHSQSHAQQNHFMEVKVA